MTDQSNLESNPAPHERRLHNQGGKGASHREPGGFRIRLSDNEMKAARAVQEAFGLRSTVAALGFAIRTIGYMLEQGKLDDLITQQNSQAQKTERIPEKIIRRNGSRTPMERRRPDPFARPLKPNPDTTNGETSTTELVNENEQIATIES